jgi:hypothetical protein
MAVFHFNSTGHRLRLSEGLSLRAPGPFPRGLHVEALARKLGFDSVRFVATLDDLNNTRRGKKLDMGPFYGQDVGYYLPGRPRCEHQARSPD